MRPSQRFKWPFCKFVRSREALPQFREGSGVLPQVQEVLKGPPAGPGMVGRTSCRSWKGRETFPVVQEAFPDFWEGSGVPPAGPGWAGGVGRTSQGLGGVESTSQRDRLGDPTACQGVVGRPTQRSGRGQEAHLEVLEGSGGPSEGLRGPPVSSVGVGRPSRRYGRGLEDLPQVWEGLVGPSAGLRGVRRPSYRFRRGWETPPEGLTGPPASPGWVGRTSLRSGRG